MNPVFALSENPLHSLQQRGKLFVADATLEDAALHARAVVFHHLGDAIEPFRVGDVIGNEQEHQPELPFSSLCISLRLLHSMPALKRLISRALHDGSLHHQRLFIDGAAKIGSRVGLAADKLG
jgi:hypothetical protein